MRKTTFLGFGILAIAAPCLAGCFDYASDCSLNPALPCFWAGQGGGGTGGSTGGGGTGGTPAECVPSDNATSVASTCGLFVSSSLGTVDGTGTQDKPFATVTAALEAWDGRPIYVCGETVTETETVKVATGDVTLYGALNCAKEWVYDPSKKSKMVGAADKATLAVGKDAGLSVVDFEVDAVDATLDGGSSVAVVAELGATLALTRCEVLAGAGKDGAPGAPPGGAASAGTVGNPGAAACTDVSVNGGASVQSACDEADPNDDSISGQGGDGDKLSGGDGSDGSPGAAMNGGDGEDANTPVCTPGGDGDPGADGTNATSGGKGVGELSSQGYQGVDGLPGDKGKPGQGGGGGGGAKGGSGAGADNCADAGNAGGASGGSGGSGGCGGRGGKGGQAAGASLGLVSLGATLTLKEVSVTTAAGGTGGTGGDPQEGGIGGPGGDGGKANVAMTLLENACKGGGGGTGGKGGLGGGGQGGHSLGLAYKGAAPDVKGVTFQIGTAGDGGTGSNNSIEVALKGDPGQACKTLSFDEGAASCVK